MKELIIIVVILIIIIGGYIFTINFLENSINQLNDELTNLKNEIYKSKEEENDNQLSEHIKEEVNNIYSKWEDTSKQWSIIILHDELDLIETSLISMKSGVESGSLQKAIEELDTSIFLINHILEKEKFNIRNIF